MKSPLRTPVLFAPKRIDRWWAQVETTYIDRWRHRVPGCGLQSDSGTEAPAISIVQLCPPVRSLIFEPDSRMGVVPIERSGLSRSVISQSVIFSFRNFRVGFRG